jgi:hypothetical protein
VVIVCRLSLVVYHVAVGDVAPSVVVCHIDVVPVSCVNKGEGKGESYCSPVCSPSFIILVLRRRSSVVDCDVACFLCEKGERSESLTWIDVDRHGLDDMARPLTCHIVFSIRRRNNVRS